MRSYKYLSSLEPLGSIIMVISSGLFLSGPLLHAIPTHDIPKIKQFVVLSNLDKVFF